MRTSFIAQLLRKCSLSPFRPLQLLRSHQPNGCMIKLLNLRHAAWEVEYVDISKKIPETVRKSPPSTPYKARRWKGFKRSPIRTCAYCQPPKNDIRKDDDNEGDDRDPLLLARIQFLRAREM
jgi:hypothetical protein